MAIGGNWWLQSLQTVESCGVEGVSQLELYIAHMPKQEVMASYK